MDDGSFEIFEAPPVLIDGIPVAVTSDLSISRDLSDLGTSNTGYRPWTKAAFLTAAERAATLVDPKRVTR